MKEVTRQEYFDSFMNKDACVSCPETGTSEWRLRNSSMVIAKSIDEESDKEGEYMKTRYFIKN